MDPKAGFGGSLGNLLADARLNHRCVLETGVLADECGRLLKEFFASRRVAVADSATADAVDQAP
jgi:tRNA(adenine34) deaminase